MSERELVKKPYSILEIEGVNERIARVEQEIGEWDEHDGCFPEYAGMQTRNFGKRLLYKFNDGVYNIFQFWTPYGYASAIVQFNGSVSATPWLTPTGGIQNLPPLNLPTDINGNTVTTIGWSANSPVPNNNTNQPVQGPVNDTNGLGGGKICHYTGNNPQTVTGVPAIGGYLYGNNSSSSFTVVGTPPGPPNPIIPTQPVVWPTSYSSASGPFGNIPYAAYTQGSFATNLGSGNWRITQNMTTANTKGTINIASLVADPINNPPSITEFQIRHNPNAPFVSTWYQIPGISWGIGGNASAFPLDVSNYIIPNYLQGPNPIGTGLLYQDFIVITAIRFTWGTLLCQ